jgi:putative transposase
MTIAKGSRYLPHWVADVTSVWTFEGRLYLAMVLDLYSRRIIGWSMGSSCKDELTTAALQMAIETRQPQQGLSRSQ